MGMALRRSNVLSCRLSVLALILLPLLLGGVANASYTCSSSAQNNANPFNFEVEKRVVDHLIHFLGYPTEFNVFIATYRRNHGFDKNMTAPDRDAYLRLVFSLSYPLVYYGLEDGTSVGSWTGYSFYREPGQSAYQTNDPAQQKHLSACVDTYNGTRVDCLMVPGAPYVKYACANHSENFGYDNVIVEDDNDDGCRTFLEPCPDQVSQQDCEAMGGEQERIDCRRNKKWCRKYTIETTTEDILDANGTSTWGFVPVTRACHNTQGLFTQEPGQALDINGSGQLGNCYFADGTTRVNRTMRGDYAYCGETAPCNPFVGGLYTDDFDPRYRPWYTQTKELQIENWSAVYVFRSRDIGITHCYPLFTDTEYGKRFDGVMAIDYVFDDFSNFLFRNYGNNYGNTTTLVAVYEDAAPHYMIGTSTNSTASGLFLSTDHSVPCENNNAYLLGDCDTLRVSIQDLSGSPYDAVLVAAFDKHVAAGYPDNLVPIKTANLQGVDDPLYISHSILFERGGVNIKWRIIIASPGVESGNEALVKGSGPLFGSVIVIAALGMVTCLVYFVLFYRRRHKRAIAFADWRFTCAFLLGCSLLNGSSFTLLGPNTDTTCLLRMWTFHLFFVIALAPLFVKVWRIRQLVGLQTHTRRSISNKRALLYTLPIIGAMAILLLILTFVDPPKQTEILEMQDGVWTQKTVCKTETVATMVATVVFEGGLVLVGCILAWRTRHLQSEFGESKQLVLAMYNIALVGTIFIIVVNVADMAGVGRKVLQAIVVFWGTVVSAGAMAIPKLIRVKPERQPRQGHAHVTGATGPMSESQRDSGLEGKP